MMKYIHLYLFMVQIEAGCVLSQYASLWGKSAFVHILNLLMKSRKNCER